MTSPVINIVPFWDCLAHLALCTRAACWTWRNTHAQQAAQPEKVSRHVGHLRETSKSPRVSILKWSNLAVNYGYSRFSNLQMAWKTLQSKGPNRAEKRTDPELFDLAHFRWDLHIGRELMFHHPWTEFESFSKTTLSLILTNLVGSFRLTGAAHQSRVKFLAHPTRCLSRQ